MYLWVVSFQHKSVLSFHYRVESISYRVCYLKTQVYGSLKVKVLIAQSCPTLCDPIDCSPPGSSVHEILQARILKWVAIPFSRGSSQPRDQTRVSSIADRFFTV